MPLCSAPPSWKIRKAQRCPSLVTFVTASFLILFSLGDGSSQGQDRSSWEREKERWEDCEQKHLSQLCYAAVTVISTFKGYFGRSVISWLSKDLLSSRGRILYCTPQHDNQTLALTSNQINYQPGSDLWSLTETCDRRRLRPPVMDLYLWGYITRPWWHWWCKLFFGGVQEEQRSAVCGWPSVCQLPPAKTVRSRWICQMFS